MNDQDYKFNVSNDDNSLNTFFECHQSTQNLESVLASCQAQEILSDHLSRALKIIYSHNGWRA